MIKFIRNGLMMSGPVLGNSFGGSE